MSSVRSLFASSTIAAAERRLRSLGRIADDSSAAFAVKPASAAQDPEPDVPPPDDPVVMAVDVTPAVATAQPAQAASPDVDAANGTMPPPAPTDDNVAMALQASRAYTRVMQTLSTAKASRAAFAPRPAKPNGHTAR